MQKKMRRMPIIIIVLVLILLTGAIAPAATFSQEQKEPTVHLLRYRPISLEWDSAEKVNEEGVAELDLFDAEYENVKSEDGRNVIAPGTEGTSTIRLENQAEGGIVYHVFMYMMKTDPELPVKARLDFENMVQLDERLHMPYNLPKGVKKEDIIDMKGMYLDGKESADINVKWNWDYFESDEQDEKDTQFGTKAAQLEPDEVVVGVYIVVYDDNEYPEDDGPGYVTDYWWNPDGTPKDPHKPSIPKTGDNSRLWQYGVLFAGSAALMAVVLFRKPKEDDPEECEE
ncbi:MAG: sortase B protein-sorting domain-containing protein [Clostridiales bacterium]|nr:sortase B protein-sorting domain-containing protein [Clostridiales bacterium]